ncbi:MAG: glycogen-binding domain-containing protein [Tepidisphaeraceae bacterium]
MTHITDNGLVEFHFYRPGAKIVQLAGCFTEWSENPLAMQSVGNGWWAVKTTLEPGEYRFRYIADGRWFTDFASYGVEKTRHGFNSVLIVPERLIRMKAA